MPQESMEIVVARLDERMVQIVDEQRRMALSYEKLVESNQRIALVESEIVSMKEGQRQLWQKVDALHAASGKSAEKWLWEIIKALLAVAGTVIAVKMFGVHL